MNLVWKILKVNEDYFNRIVLALRIIDEAKEDLPIKVFDELELVLRGEVDENNK